MERDAGWREGGTTIGGPLTPDSVLGGCGSLEHLVGQDLGSCDGVDAHEPPACAQPNSLHGSLMVGAPRQVTVQVQGQEVLSEKMEPSNFQPLLQTKPQTPERRPRTPSEATQESPLGLRVKEEPTVTQDPGEGGQGMHGPKPDWVDQRNLASAS